MEQQDIQQAKDLMSKSEATRLKLVEKINSKRNQGTLAFGGGDASPKFIREHDALVKEHNRIAEIQNSIREGMQEYMSVTGTGTPDDLFMNFTGLFKGWKERRTVKKEAKAEAKDQGLKGKDKRSYIKDAKYDAGVMTKGGERHYVKKTTKEQAIADGLSKKDARQKGKEAIWGTPLQSKVWQKAKTGTLAAPRGSFLSLLQLNFWSMAKGLKVWKDAKDPRYIKVRNKWYGMGGNRSEFDRIVDKGAKNRPVNFLYKKGSFGAKKNATGEQLNVAVVDDAAVASLITAAGGVLTTLITAFRSEGGKVTQPTGSDIPDVTDKDRLEMEEIQRQIASGELDPDKDFTWAWLLGGSVLVGGLLLGYYYYKNNN